MGYVFLFQLVESHLKCKMKVSVSSIVGLLVHVYRVIKLLASGFSVECGLAYFQSHFQSELILILESVPEVR